MTIIEFKNHYIELVRKGVKFDSLLVKHLEQALGLFELFQERTDQGINYDMNHDICISREMLEFSREYTPDAKHPFRMVHMITFAHEIASTVFEKEENVTLFTLGEEISGKGHLCLKKRALQYTFEYDSILNSEDKQTYWLYSFNK